MASTSGSEPSGPPYLPKNAASLGGTPSVHEDIPVLAVLIVLYFISGISHVTIFRRNKAKGHKFWMSFAIAAFSMSRVGTCVLRVASTTRPKNISLAIAALLFTNIGVLIDYIVVLLLSHRMLRATHPKLGWNRFLSNTIKGCYIGLAAALIFVIAFTVLSFYTLNTTLRTVALWIQRVCLLYLLLFNVISLVFYLISLLAPRATITENFGASSMREKYIILGVVMFFTEFIAGFRFALDWAPTRPPSDPGWYETKPAFYVILFGFEIIIIYTFLLSRFDKKFWVPDHSKGPGDYSGKTSRDMSLSSSEAVAAA